MSDRISTITAILIIIFIAMVLFSGVFGYWKYMGLKSDVVSPEVQQIPAQNNSETASWNTYRNDEYGFEFQYPLQNSTFIERADLDRCDDGTDLAVRCRVFTNDSFMLQIIPHSLDQKAIHKLDGSVLMGESVKTANEETIGGKQGYEYSITTSTNYNVSGFMVPLTDNSYLEAIKNFKGPGETVPWQKIISTFKFTK